MFHIFVEISFEWRGILRTRLHKGVRINSWQAHAVQLTNRTYPRHQQNHAFIAAVPRGGIRVVRIHDLLFLLRVPQGTTPEGLTADRCASNIHLWPWTTSDCGALPISTKSLASFAHHTCSAYMNSTTLSGHFGIK